MSREISSPSASPVYPLGGEEWKTWADGFKKLAEATPRSAERGFKEDAKRAHIRMVELFPELFCGT